jgi:hypothetical protein
MTSNGVEAFAGVAIPVRPTKVRAAAETIAISFLEMTNSFEIRPNTIAPSLLPSVLLNSTLTFGRFRAWELWVV